MTGLYVSVPIACWRRGHAREYIETETCPPPATLYGFLLSLVGEWDRRAHVGVRVSGGVIGSPPISRVLRTTWRIKSASIPQGVGENARPDWQELVTGSELVVFLSSEDEPKARGPSLEDRIAIALDHPEHIRRSGGLSLGESTHLVDVVRRLRPEDLARGPEVFLADSVNGDCSQPVWVDHVGGARTRYAVGRFALRGEAPGPDLLPQIRPE